MSLLKSEQYPSYRYSLYEQEAREAKEALERQQVKLTPQEFQQKYGVKPNIPSDVTITGVEKTEQGYKVTYTPPESFKSKVEQDREFVSPYYGEVKGYSYDPKRKVYMPYTQVMKTSELEEMSYIIPSMVITGGVSGLVGSALKGAKLTGLLAQTGISAAAGGISSYVWSEGDVETTAKGAALGAGLFLGLSTIGYGVQKGYLWLAPRLKPKLWALKVQLESKIPYSWYEQAEKINIELLRPYRQAKAWLGATEAEAKSIFNERLYARRDIDFATDYYMAADESFAKWLKTQGIEIWKGRQPYVSGYEPTFLTRSIYGTTTTPEALAKASLASGSWGLRIAPSPPKTTTEWAKSFSKTFEKTITKGKPYAGGLSATQLIVPTAELEPYIPKFYPHAKDLVVPTSLISPVKPQIISKALTSLVPIQSQKSIQQQMAQQVQVQRQQQTQVQQQVQSQRQELRQMLAQQIPQKQIPRLQPFYKLPERQVSVANFILGKRRGAAFYKRHPVPTGMEVASHIFSGLPKGRRRRR